MVTLKFGGTSVADAAALTRLCTIVAHVPGERVVVVSALSGTTDALLALARTAATGDLRATLDAIAGIRERHAAICGVVRDPARRARLLTDLGEPWTELEALARAAVILRSAPPAVRDAIAACGELASSRIVAAALDDAGVPAVWIDARAVVATNSGHERAVPLAAETAARARAVIGPALRRGAVAVVGGFVGSTADGITTTLGRGGSDLSASLIGACLDATEIQIWTDTDGVLTADPRILARVDTVPSLSFREASALAHFGAKVLHPATVAPAVDRGIPVRILNSRRPDAAGTTVTRDTAGRHNPFAGVACLSDVIVADVALPADATRERVLAGVFGACAEEGATIYASAIGDTRVSVTIGAGGPAREAVARCRALGVTGVREDLGLLAVVGDGLIDGRAFADEVLRSVRGATLAVIAAAPEAGFVAIGVPRADLARATAEVHARFFEARGRVAPVPRWVPSRVPPAVPGDGIAPQEAAR